MIIARTKYGELNDNVRGQGSVSDDSLDEEQVLIVSIEGGSSPSIMKGICVPKKAKDSGIFFNAKDLEIVPEFDATKEYLSNLIDDIPEGTEVILKEINDEDITLKAMLTAIETSESKEGRPAIMQEENSNKKNNAESGFQQKILFGCPGTGKSYKVDNEILIALKISEKNDGVIQCKNEKNLVKCVFHPEYSYGDFMGKLMPLTQGNSVTYHYYPGHFLRALAQAYKNINYNSSENVALVIDEINRGNTAAIFGPVLQLLDREENGWSSYKIKLSDMEHQQLVALILGSEDLSYDKYGKLTSPIGDCDQLGFIHEGEIKLPYNLSIIGTMNTSDESIYYMDSAFKRRWDWGYIDLKAKRTDNNIGAWLVEGGQKWCDFVDELNEFIKGQASSIRRVEDKQIGYWFIKAKNDKTITKDQIKNKLMFFLWDSVFQRDKSPLETLLGMVCENETDDKKVRLVTFGDFTDEVDNLIEILTKKQYSEGLVEDTPEK